MATFTYPANEVREALAAALRPTAEYLQAAARPAADAMTTITFRAPEENFQLTAAEAQLFCRNVQIVGASDSLDKGRLHVAANAEVEQLIQAKRLEVQMLLPVFLEELTRVVDTQRRIRELALYANKASEVAFTVEELDYWRQLGVSI